MRRGFLIVDDDPHITRAFSSVLETLGPVHVAHSAKAALEVIHAERLSGLVIDVKLGDESGLDVLATIREEDAVVPALVVTHHAEPEFINRALELQANYACKPLKRDMLLRFAQRAMAVTEVSSARVDAAASALAAQVGLSPSEERILRLAAAGMTRADIIHARAVSPHTHHSQVQSLLRKLGEERLESAVIRLLRSVVSDEASQPL